MFTFGYGQPRPQHLPALLVAAGPSRPAPGPAGTASTHGRCMAAKGQGWLHGDLSLGPPSLVATASLGDRR